MTTTTSKPPEASQTPVAKDRAYVGGYIDKLLAKLLQQVANKESRGNRTFTFERYIREGLEREKILPVGV